MKSVENKVAIVTGAASGIGKATAELLAREGAKLVISDIDEKRGQEVVAGIRGNQGTSNFRKSG